MFLSREGSLGGVLGVKPTNLALRKFYRRPSISPKRTTTNSRNLIENNFNSNTANRGNTAATNHLTIIVPFCIEHASRPSLAIPLYLVLVDNPSVCQALTAKSNVDVLFVASIAIRVKFHSKHFITERKKLLALRGSTNSVTGGAESASTQTYEPGESSFHGVESATTAETEISTTSQDASDQDSTIDTTNLVPEVPLYEGSLLSTGSSHLLLKSFMCCYHLTGQAQEDLLQLVQLHLPKEKLPSSRYLFQKQNNQLEHNELCTYHHYCPHCFTTIPNSATTECQNRFCGQEVQFDTSPYFITVSISDQLKTLLSSKFGFLATCLCTSQYK